jgi:putative membrane protein
MPGGAASLTWDLCLMRIRAPMRHIWNNYRWLILFTLTYLLGAAYFYGRQGNWEFIAYLGVTVFIGLVILATATKSGLDHLVLWMLSVWGLLHMLGGILPVGDKVLYGWRIYPFLDRGGDFFILKMDQVIHFYGFMAAAIVMHQLIAKRSIQSVHPGMLIFFATMGSLGLSAVNEIIEFLAMVSLEETGVGDIYNMGLDLIFNGAGALAGAFLQQWRFAAARR